jgi:hypothetical protein
MDDESWIEANPAPPRYCPRCRLEGKADGPLCAECGEALRDQSYCPICEGFWKLDPGADCPKHEVELLDEAPPPPRIFASPGERTSLVTVATFSHPNQANAPRIRLEAEGIPTFLDGEHVAGNSFSQVATGCVRLQVPTSLASAARVLISQTWSTPVEPDEDLDDAFEELAPEPGRRRRAIMKLAIWVILLGPVVVFLVSLLSAVLGDRLR